MDEQVTPQSTSQAPAAPVAPTTAPTPTPDVAPASTLSEEASELLLNFRAIDRKQEGAGLHQIRQFYRGVGWNVIRASVKELEQAGLLTGRTELNDRGGVSHILYTWKAV